MRQSTIRRLVPTRAAPASYISSSGGRLKRARLSVETLDDRAVPATFTVNTGADDGPGSFRQAILDSNANGGADTIAFNIGGGGVQTILPTSILPEVTDRVMIDGTTQPGYAGSPLIVINGSQAGSPTPLDGLVISGGNSTVRGLVIDAFSGAGLVLRTNGGNLIVGNYLGTDVTGTTVESNGVGLRAESSSNTIGGTATGAGNLISGNTEYGLFLTSGARTNTVQGNRIGTDVTGTAPLGNGVGVRVLGDTNWIGGGSAGAPNVISANHGDGIAIEESDARFNLIHGNSIGTDAEGTRALGNGGDGISITGSAQNTIGLLGLNWPNKIAFNQGAGVSVLGADAIRNTIRMNTIHSNAGLSIDLGGDGVTANDPGDVDSGPNKLQNTPVIHSVIAGANTRVIGSLSTTAAFTTLMVEFYAGRAFGPSGYNEPPRLLAVASVDTFADGTNTFDFTLSAATAADDVVTATATDKAGNTSEFSAGRVAGTAVDIQPSDPANVVHLGGGRVVSVAVLTTDDFDAATVDATDLSRIRFGDTKGTARVSPTRESLGDVDGDGDLDRVFIFPAISIRRSGALTASSVEAEITGYTYAGLPFRGVDSVTVEVPPLQDPTIDIRPGDAVNAINLVSDSLLSVVVLTTPDFDAGDVDGIDLSRIHFGDVNGTARVSPVRESLGDVNGDGEFDRVFVFSVRDIRRSGALTPTTAQAELTGFTFGGEPFRGVDGVTVSHPLQILAPALEFDPFVPGTTVLVVDGTPGTDQIVVRPWTGSKTQLEVLVNGNRFGPFAPTGGIRVIGYGANDRITVGSSITRNAIIEGWTGNDTLTGALGRDLLTGGDGNDTLYGRQGNDVAVGGAGADTLYGGMGRNVLIGGEGADRLVAGGGDLLVAGRTLFDANSIALGAVFDEWTSDRAYGVRVANLRGDDNSQFAARLNADYFLRSSGLGQTAFDDGERDVLIGGLGRDWFLANRTGGVSDVLAGSSSAEIKDELA